MLITLNNIKEKKVIVFDLDGTLAVSKGSIDDEMASLLGKLLRKKKVAVISGGGYPQFEKQFLSNLTCDEYCFSNLYIFPTNASRFYRYEDGWKNIYSEDLSRKERDSIIVALKESLKEVGYEKPEMVYGDIIEDRGSQITFSGLGQEAPLRDKSKWDPKHLFREKVIEAFSRRMPDFSARIGGTTSIDINRRGVDKAYGIEQIKKILDVGVEEIIYVGDALFPGGNDYAVKKTGVDTISVSNPEDTKRFIESLLT